MLAAGRTARPASSVNDFSTIRPSHLPLTRRNTTLNRFPEHQATRDAAPSPPFSPPSSGATPPRGLVLPDHTVQRAERQLLDGVERILRAPEGRLTGWALLALHLSAIPPPGARPHHRRVAAAVLGDAASRSNGQLFALKNGDLALLFRPTDQGSTLSHVLARLFAADMPEIDELRTLFPLPRAAVAALQYVRARVQEGDRAAPRPEHQPGTSAVAAIDAIVQVGALSDLMHRQTAVLVRPSPPHALAQTKQQPVTLIPLFREVTISTAVLEARIALTAQNPVSVSATDPFLFNHLASRLDHRMLAELALDIPRGGTLSLGLGGAALHINMTVSGILSEAFARFATACKTAIAAGLRMGVEVPFVEAFADVRSFVLARERLRLAGLATVLDGVSHKALVLSSPAVLAPALVKLDWSPAMHQAGPELDAAVARLRPERLLLHRVETEAALAWGLERGIMRFQGRYVDAMLAAERLRACPQSAACTLPQCVERASATGPAARTGCRNTTLLDRAAPNRSDPAPKVPA